MGTQSLPSFGHFSLLRFRFDRSCRQFFPLKSTCFSLSYLETPSFWMFVSHSLDLSDEPVLSSYSVHRHIVTDVVVPAIIRKAKYPRVAVAKDYNESFDSPLTDNSPRTSLEVLFHASQHLVLAKQ